LREASLSQTRRVAREHARVSFGSRAHAFDERAFDIRHERATSRRQRVRAVVRSHRRVVSVVAAGEWWSEVMHATRFTVVACKRTSGA